MSMHARACCPHALQRRPGFCHVHCLKTVCGNAVMVMKFFFDHYGFTSSGAVAALVMGLLAKELWKRGIPRKLSGEQTWMSGNHSMPCFTEFCHANMHWLPRPADMVLLV